jgi:hypothetical protein
MFKLLRDFREVFVIIIVGIGLVMTLNYIKQQGKPQHKQSFTFIWNSDDEGLPPIGETVIIEDIKGDSIWLVAKEDYIPK